MRVKRYVVDSMPDALQRIRVELGKDAVILNTKEIKSGGFLGFFSKKRIEVIAATDNTFSAPKQAPQIPTQPSQAYETLAPLTAVRTPQVESQTNARISVLEQPIFMEQQNELKPVSEQAQVTITPRTKEIDDVLIDEVRQVKELFLRFSAKENIMKSPEPFQVIQRRLLEQEIEPNIVELLITNALAEQDTPGYQWTDGEAAKAIRKGLYEILHNDGQKAMSRDVQIAHFVGPTGVGKTTTIAKLAAEQVLKYNRKVGFITSDTYRIAAIEQLKTYATILNIPLEVVFSPQELVKTFKLFADRDIIFMDTAGRNFRNEMYVSELNTLLKENGNSETYLVLSLTSKYRDMKTITENFSKFKIDKILYTKMDETDSYGSIVNIAHDFSLNCSYVTNGQNVPDDINEINENQIVDLIMGGIGHE
jgi:flagellar biosynthesis protein FlhF